MAGRSVESGPIFAGLDIGEGKLLCHVLYVIEMGLDRIERVDLPGVSDQLGKFKGVVPWTAANVGNRHPRRNLQTFNNLARLLPLFSPWIIEQNKIFQECDSFPAGFVIGIREFGQDDICGPGTP